MSFQRHQIAKGLHTIRKSLSPHRWPPTPTSLPYIENQTPEDLALHKIYRPGISTLLPSGVLPWQQRNANLKLIHIARRQPPPPPVN